jgi:hypothetical protein
MKRAAFLLIIALVILAFQIISNCSQPLESSDLNPSPGPGFPGRVDTLFVFDTVVIVHNGRVDTLIAIDTIIQTDTVTQIDTTYGDTVTDTVFVGEPGEGDGQMLCARLSSSQQEIVWLFRNAEGPYHLEFAALPERDHPTHTLAVTIDGQTYDWSLSESLELVLDQNLGSNAMIRILTSKPPSFGHAIDICLTVARL